MKMDKGMMGHMRMHAWKMLVLGLLVLANTYWQVMTWDYFIGGILTLAGLWKVLMPCKECMM